MKSFLSIFIVRTLSHITTRAVSAALLFAMLFAFGGCDLVDATRVQNPATTEPQLLANPNGGTRAVVVGLRRQFSVAISNNSQVCEVVSDNYKNVTTFVSVQLDLPRTIDLNDITVGNAYIPTQSLLALAEFGIKNTVNNSQDLLATEAQRAQVFFYRGMALLMLSEKFVRFPLEENGALITASDARKQAIGSFREALRRASAATGAQATDNTATPAITATEIATRCHYALARAYRLEGNKDSAVFFARAGLMRDPNYLFSATFDVVNLGSAIQEFVSNRTDHAFQPNPRLDFLDPKFIFQAATVNDPHPSLKAEEAHLIIAEVALSNNDLAAARTAMTSAVQVARNRPVRMLQDRDTRPNRPNNPAFSVRADAMSPAIPNLIVRRPAVVPVYGISYTNQTADSIAALAQANREEHVYMLYLLRQHIFFCEGRRIEDLGIKLPLPRRQVDTNPTLLSAGATGSDARSVVPSFIPNEDEMDQFSTAGNIVTMRWDMNRIIARNIRQLSPFSGF
jgi:hypothetical protein